MKPWIISYGAYSIYWPSAILELVSFNFMTYGYIIYRIFRIGNLSRIQNNNNVLNPPTQLFKNAFSLEYVGKHIILTLKFKISVKFRVEWCKVIRKGNCFYPEKPAKDDKSRAWIRFFIRICEDLIFGVFFHSCAKFAFLSGFHHVKSCFFIRIWIRSKFFGATIENG